MARKVCPYWSQRTHLCCSSSSNISSFQVAASLYVTPALSRSSTGETFSPDSKHQRHIFNKSWQPRTAHSKQQMCLWKQNFAKCQVLVTKLLQCDSCSFYTNNKTELESHMQTHLANTSVVSSSKRKAAKKGRTGTYKHQCSQCNINFLHPETLTWHKKNCHSAEAVVKMIKTNPNKKKHHFQCVLCQTVCTEQYHIIWHLRHQHEFNQLPFQCNYCDSQFVHSSHMRQHLLKCKNGCKEFVKDKKCSECGIRFSYAELLTWHAAFCHHGSNTIVKVVKVNESGHEFQCNFCESMYTKHDKIVQHLQSQHKISNLPFQCKRCGNQFTHFNKLKRHRLTRTKCVKKKVSYQTEQNSVQCKLCRKSFKSQLKMKNHISNYHAIRKEKKKMCVTLKCRYCNVSFSSYKPLFSHCRYRHPAENVAQCDICNFEFLNYHSFIWHMKYKHSGLVFACKICPANFSYPGILRQHKKRLHSLLKNSLPCEICGAKFKSKEALHRHAKEIHVGPMLQCGHCQYKTRSKTSLTIHLKCHHQDKQLSCRFCSAKFKCQQYLSRHVRVNHTGPVLHCEHCPFSSRSKCDLIRHHRRKHFK